MNSLMIGVSFGVWTLCCFYLMRMYLDLKMASILSLLLSVMGFGIYMILKKPPTRNLLFISLLSGLSFTLFADIGIYFFPPTKIRDLWDILMPYVFSFLTGLQTSFLYIILTILFGWYRKRENRR